VERGTSAAPRSGLRSLTAVRAEATAVLASEANKGMAPLPHIELADSIPKKPAVKNFYAVWPKFVAIDLWRSGPNWTATMDQSHSAADNRQLPVFGRLACPVRAEATKHVLPGPKSLSCPVAVCTAVGTTWEASKLGGLNVMKCLQPSKRLPRKSCFAGRSGKPILCGPGEGR